MVRSGIIKALPAENELIATLNNRKFSTRQGNGTTRSAAAVELWDRLEGAVVAVGNAPTTLFHLLEKMDQGGPKPAVILGFQSGLSVRRSQKQSLRRIEGRRILHLRGRRGISHGVCCS